MTEKERCERIAAQLAMSPAVPGSIGGQADHADRIVKAAQALMAAIDRAYPGPCRSTHGDLACELPAGHDWTYGHRHTGHRLGEEPVVTRWTEAPTEESP